MARSMDGKVALVTGAAGGIGRATALAFATEGARVVVGDISDEGAAETVRMIETRGGTAFSVHCDVTSLAEVNQMVAETVARFGRLDFAFNNAGTEGVSGSTHLTEPAVWDRVLSINLTGAWYCMRAEIPAMQEHGGGVIVNCSSVAGLVGFPGSSAYCASKHGLVGLTKAAALDYATSGIRVNAVCPGVIDTEMVHRAAHHTEEGMAAMRQMEPIGRLGTPDEIADAVVWLCSDKASFVTGQAIAVDGGLTTR